MVIVGLAAYFHDSSSALVRDGHLVAAAQEERFSRKKYDARFPRHALQYCLQAGGIELSQVDYVIFYEKPFLKFERLLETQLAFAPRGFRSFAMALPVWLREKLFLRKVIGEELCRIDPEFSPSSKLLFSEHHLSHAASAFYPSPFDRAAILTMDGVGEWATTSFAIGRGKDLHIRREIHFPHSLGLLYSAFTYYTGFKVNSGEYKVMGLAPYGKPSYANLIKDHLIDIKTDGSFLLNMEFFDYCSGLRMTNERFDRLFGGPPRHPTEPLTQRHMDLAASIQQVTEDVVLRMTRSIAKETGERNLCLAGGVALNCVANGKILKDGYFDSIWVQPAAGDSGGSVGAALAAYHIYIGADRSPVEPDAMSGSLLGPEFLQTEIESRLRAEAASFDVLSDAQLLNACTDSLSAGAALGWFQGRMEFGPRALGSRSILADPRSPKMQSQLNLKVKFRESFRPFAPAVLRSKVTEWFDIDEDSPYMLLVAEVQPAIRLDVADDALFGIEQLRVPRSRIPAVTHIDFSARVQTVDSRSNPRFLLLLEEWDKITGCPVLVNTSFNVRGEPIVCTPEDAFRCFMGTDIEVLAIGNCLLRKERQNPALKRRYEQSFELD